MCGDSFFCFWLDYTSNDFAFHYMALHSWCKALMCVASGQTMQGLLSHFIVFHNAADHVRPTLCVASGRTMPGLRAHLITKLTMSGLPFCGLWPNHEQHPFTCHNTTLRWVAKLAMQGIPFLHMATPYKADLHTPLQFNAFHYISSHFITCHYNADHVMQPVLWPLARPYTAGFHIPLHFITFHNKIQR